MNKLIRLLATGFNSGFSPVAPGTVGTIVGLALTWLWLIFGFEINFPLVFILVVVGTYLADSAEKFFGKKDAQQIVIDEIVGFVIAIYGLGINMLIPAFVLFRLFDILKPPPINKFQELEGGVGVMVDDILAGIMANLLLRLILFFV
ncbi:phosphatidylglycerophosphatase A [Natroniella sulfidigena]|uniref:phosphatidylglycerophosphatase A family protein n=1 Tax=Natroniella sulfidigena TaxID=723921 RepID=UPI00200A03CA|nr:phosphatidylglycerophosphatase A [Natroniella sulfidigena]MCK8817418.1 phosphatidylglycerophosphatase A [Natroniella sulfidigena]